MVVLSLRGGKAMTTMEKPTTSKANKVAKNTFILQFLLLDLKSFVYRMMISKFIVNFVHNIPRLRNDLTIGSRYGFD